MTGLPTEDPAARARRPVPRALAALAVVLATAALVTRGLSSGTGQALESPGSVMVLDTLCALAALAAVGARVVAGEPLFALEAGRLAPLAAFVGLAGLAALHGPDTGSGARTAFSWAAIAALAVAAHDLGRRPGVARSLLGVLVGTAVAASILGLHQLWYEYPLIRDELRKGPQAALALGIPLELYEPMRWRVEDAKACGPFLLPSHLATDMALVAPLAVAATVLAWRRRRASLGRRALLVALGATDLALAAGVASARSKGATLALGTALAAFAWLALPRGSVARRRLAWGAGLALLAALVWAGLGYAFRPERFGVGLSLQVRLEYWDAALRTFRESPLVGHGLESFPTEYAVHKSARAEEVRHAHQDALELATEEGILGPLVLAWLAAALGVVGVRRLRADPARASGEDGREAPPALPAWLATTVGVALGGLWLSGFGDVFDASRPWHLLVACGVTIGVARAFEAALGGGDDPDARRLVGAAALAGALALLVDGLTDFPLRVHGLLAFGLVLAVVGPELGGRLTSGAAPRIARGAGALVVVALVLVGMRHGREIMADDALRNRARALVATAERVLSHQTEPGRLDRADREAAALLLERPSADVRALLVRPTLTPLEVHEVALALLDEGTETLRRLHEVGALAPPEVVGLLVPAEEQAGRLAHDARRFETILKELEFAVTARPRSFALQAELGRRLARADRLDEAARAFDAAVALSPTDPRAHLDAGVVRVERLVRDGTLLVPGPVRDRATFELETTLELAHASRLDRVHLDAGEIAVARGLLIALGAPLPGADHALERGG